MSVITRSGISPFLTPSAVILGIAAANSETTIIATSDSPMILPFLFIFFSFSPPNFFHPPHFAIFNKRSTIFSLSKKIKIGKKAPHLSSFSFRYAYGLITDLYPMSLVNSTLSPYPIDFSLYVILEPRPAAPCPSLTYKPTPATTKPVPSALIM